MLWRLIQTCCWGKFVAISFGGGHSCVTRVRVSGKSKFPTLKSDRLLLRLKTLDIGCESVKTKLYGIYFWAVIFLQIIDTLVESVPIQNQRFQNAFERASLFTPRVNEVRFFGHGALCVQVIYD